MGLRRIEQGTCTNLVLQRRKTPNRDRGRERESEGGSYGASQGNADATVSGVHTCIWHPRVPGTLHGDTAVAALVSFFISSLLQHLLAEPLFATHLLASSRVFGVDA